MTVDEIMLEIEILDDKEFENLYKNICISKDSRRKAKKREAIQKLREAWIAVTSLGIDICNNEGDIINNFEDLKFD